MPDEPEVMTGPATASEKQKFAQRLAELELTSGEPNRQLKTNPRNQV
jgi:hypothetical protein